MKDVNKRRQTFFLFLNLSSVPKKSTPGKFAYIRHFHRTGINATKFEKKTPIHFKSDVFAAVAVVDAKSPSYGPSDGCGGRVEENPGNEFAFILIARWSPWEF